MFLCVRGGEKANRGGSTVKLCAGGMIGCLCFSIGDWMLGYVNPALVESDIFFFIRMGHGVGYDMS